MNYENLFKDMFDSILDYRKIVFLVFLIKIDTDLLKQCGFLKSDINRLDEEFKTNLIEQDEEYLDHNKNQEEAHIEQFLDKKNGK